MLITPVAIDPPGLPPPDPGDRATFTPRKLEEGRWMRDDVVPGTLALAQATYHNAGEAATSAETAADSADEAQAAAQTALNAPGTNGTSATSMAIGLGSKTFATQTGKAWVPGHTVTIARTSDPAASRMSGTITAYNSGTGSLTVMVNNRGGSGTFNDWTISFGGFPFAGVLSCLPVTANTPFTAAVGIDYLLDADDTPVTAPSIKAVDEVFQVQLVNERAGCSVDFGTDKVRGRTVGVLDLDNENACFKLKWSGTTYGWVNA